MIGVVGQVQHCLQQKAECVVGVGRRWRYQAHMHDGARIFVIGRRCTGSMIRRVSARLTQIGSVSLRCVSLQSISLGVCEYVEY